MGVTSAMRLIFNPDPLSTLRAASLPGPGPLMYTSISLAPFCFATSTTFAIATVAAYGVDFFDPENPAVPVEPQHTVFPSTSVNVAMVLLNVAVTYILPLGTFFTVLLAVFRFDSFFAAIFPSGSLSSITLFLSWLLLALLVYLF